MKRGWVSTRDQTTDFGEGSETAQRKAMILAEIADAELLDSFIRIVSAMQAFGGKAFIAAQRRKLDAQGNIVGHNEVGQYDTLAYVVHYDHENVRSITGEPAEPDLMFKDVERLFTKLVLGEEPAPEPEANGAPEPVAVTPQDED
jgi:hypothetical protein